MLERNYSFKSNDYDVQGAHKSGDKDLMDFFHEATSEFHKYFGAYYANQLITSSLTMLKLERASQMEPEFSFGMELVNGKPDMAFNDEMKKHMDKRMVYAMATNLEGREDEPIYLYIDDNLDNETMILKYSPEDDDDYDKDDDDSPIYFEMDKSSQSYKDIYGGNVCISSNNIIYQDCLK